MSKFVVRDGMSRSVFENKYSRKNGGGGYQSWSERIKEVIDGNFSLLNKEPDRDDYLNTLSLAERGILVSSGRHLQHGDLSQKSKPGEVFVNCSTAMFSFIKFWLLLKGSGVGRCYDSDLCRVNWDYMPNVRIVIDGPDNLGNGGHPDYEPWMEKLSEAERKYDSESESVRWFVVDDSAEGWSSVIQILETASWQEKHKDKLYVFDFSGIRRRGEPIRGQQNRPSSGPAPLMRALNQVISIKGAGMKPWKQAMYIDHYLASCILVGGIRNSSRIAVKSWRDRDIFEFIDIKRGGFLYTANNSVSVDSEFWDQASNPGPSHGRRVFQSIVSASYFDGTGEPAFLNLDNMCWNGSGVENITAKNILNPEISSKLDIHDKTIDMIESILGVAKKKKYPYIVNPCGEIVLSLWGGYCTIGDVCLSNVINSNDAFEAVKSMVRFLIRTNTMNFLYKSEVDRTNRIGVSIIGIHEFAYRKFGFNFYDLINEEKSILFWNFISELRMAAEDEAERFSRLNNLSRPHTVTTIKPAGTTAKVMSCTEGCHLPAYDYYIRWVQYQSDSYEVKRHIDVGYPCKDISHAYPGKVVIGFPTKMPIVDIMGDDVVLSNDASMDDQYKWLRLLEKHWLGSGNNQISYTMKYNPDVVSFDAYMDSIIRNQKYIRACSFTAQVNESVYAYVPEEKISKERYYEIMKGIRSVSTREGYDDRELCQNGHCPIEFDK